MERIKPHQGVFYLIEVTSWQLSDIEGERDTGTNYRGPPDRKGVQLYCICFCLSQ